MNVFTVMFFFNVCIILLIQRGAAMRRSSRRTDLANVPAVTSYGFTLPLQGSETCFTSEYCTSTLPPPSTQKTLQYFSIARGINTYSCAGQQSDQPPLFLSQQTILWDAAPLISKVPQEASFHTLVPQMLLFDYAQLKNSSLVCIGYIGSNGTTSIVDLFKESPFNARVQNFVNAPEHPEKNMQWARSTSADMSWEVYRVETANGTPPSNCKEHQLSIQLDYAAEYWFYR